MRALVLAAVLLLAGCATYQDEYAQLPLFGDRKCSDPVFGQMADQCCFEHDRCFHARGRWAPDGEPLSDGQAFRLCNVEFEACMLEWGVPPKIAGARRKALDYFGRPSFEGTKQ